MYHYYISKKKKQVLLEDNPDTFIKQNNNNKVEYDGGDGDPCVTEFDCLSGFTCVDENVCRPILIDIPYQKTTPDDWCSTANTVHQDVPSCGRVCSDSDGNIGIKSSSGDDSWPDAKASDCPDAKLDRIWKDDPENPGKKKLKIGSYSINEHNQPQSQITPSCTLDLYTAHNRGGKKTTIHEGVYENVSSVSSYDNDSLWSFELKGDDCFVNLFDHHNHNQDEGGATKLYGTGFYNLNENGFFPGGKMTSALVYDQPDKCEVYLYEGKDREGKKQILKKGEYSDISDHGFGNDKLKSIEVFGKNCKATVYDKSRFRGTNATFEEGFHNVFHRFSKGMSSIKVYS